MQRKLQRQTSTGNAVRVHKPQSLKRLLISSERLLSTDKNVFSQWAELGGRGPALIQAWGGDRSSATPEPRNSASCQVYWLGFSTGTNVEGLLDRGCLRPTRPSGRVGLSAKSTLVNPKLLQWPITDGLVPAGRRVRISTQLVRVSSSSFKKPFPNCFLAP